MRDTRRWMCLVTILPLLAACPQKTEEAGGTEGGGEDMTVVVEADKSQILQQEEKLKVEQDQLEEERERLAQAREDVLSKISSLSKKDRKQRKDLEAEQARLAKEEQALRQKLGSFDKERADLERKKTELIESISALTGQGAGSGAMARRIQIVEKRQQDILEAQEKNEKILVEIRDMVRAIQESGGGSRTVVVNNPSPPPPADKGISKSQVARLEAAIRAKMKAKGILEADLPPAAHEFRATAEKAAKNKDWGTAHGAYTQLDGSVSGLKVDHDFVQAKMGRINKSYEGKMKTLNEKKKSKVLALLDDVSDSFSDGRFDRANRKINQLHSLLEGN